MSVNWNEILSLDPQAITDDEKDDLAESLFFIQPEEGHAKEQILKFLNIVQEIGKHKSAQVDELLIALDEAAAREAAVRSGSPTNNQLEFLLSEKEKELIAEKNENERLTSQLLRVEREKNELSRELAAVQEEGGERGDRHFIDSPVQERVDALINSLRQKNGHIMQLLEDIDVLEDDNAKLKEALVKTSNQSENFQQTESELIQKIKVLEVHLSESSEKNKELIDQNEALEWQVRELNEKKEKHDKELDEFADTLNLRIEEWKQLIDLRDEEIAIAREEIVRLSATTHWVPETIESEVKKLHEQIKEQDQEISRLNEELKLNKKPQVIQNVHQFSTEHEREVLELRNTISELETRLKFAEEDAHLKAEELTTLLVHLKTTEPDDSTRGPGELSLFETIQKIKAADKIIKEKDQYILELIDSCNHLEIEKEDCQEEIIWLKEKLGWSPTRNIDHEILQQRRENRTLVLNNLKKEVSDQKEIILELKLKNQVLKRSSCPENVNISDIIEQKDDLIAENDALRKGLHEILQCIQVETLGEIKAISLEKLLRALDARHVSGWYHPAMRLQAELGENRASANELRVQIRALKIELAAKNNALIEAQEIKHNPSVEKIEIIETKLSSPTEKTAEPPNELIEMRYEAEQRCIALENQIRQMRVQMEKSNVIKDMRDEISTSDESFDKNNIKSLKLSLDYLRSLFLTKEDVYLKDVMKLQREKSDLIIQLHQFELEMLTCEPRKNIEVLSKDLTVISAKYDQVLKQFLIQYENGDNNKVDHLENDKIVILEQLKTTKEKLFEAETCLKAHEKSLVSPDGFNAQVAELSKRLAIAETEATTGKLRIAENEKMIAKLQLNESRWKDLIDMSKIQNELNEKLQNTIADLEIELVRTKVESEKSLEAVEYKVEELRQDKKHAEELMEISQEQLHSLRSWVESRHEIFIPDDIEKEELKSKKHNLELKLNNTTIQNVELKERLEEGWEEARKNRRAYVRHVKTLYQILNTIQIAFNNNNQFITLERARQLYVHTSEQAKHLQLKETIIEEKIKNILIKEGELEKQLEAVNELKTSFKGDANQLINWHNNSTQLRLSEMKARKQFEFLTEQVSRRDEELRKLEHEILNFEEVYVKREQEWNERLRQWQIMQRELCEWVQKPFQIDNEQEEIILERSEPVGNGNLIELAQEPKEEIASPTELTPVETTVPPIAVREAIIQHEQKSQRIEMENVALKTTVSSLQDILKQKENTIVRFQNLLKSCRQEHAEDIKNMQADLQKTRQTMNDELKKISENKPKSKGIEDYFKELQELDEELGTTKRDLQKATEEAENWKKIASERANEGKEIINRLEEELDRCKNEIQKYQLQTQQNTETTFLSTIEKLQNKLSTLETNRKPLEKHKKEDDKEKIINNLEADLKASKEDCAKLREQLSKIRAMSQKSKDSFQHDKMLQKLKSLEDMLKLSKAHEKELEEKGIQRVKSAEGVARWNEKKRHQQNLEKLQAKIKEKDVALVVANSKIETLRGLMGRGEQEKFLLEEQLKKAGKTNRGFDKLYQEKIVLSAQIASLQEELTILRERETSAQERKISENSSEEDFDVLQRRNSKLQNDILSLNVKVEKLKFDNQNLKEKLQSTKSQKTFQERTVSPQRRHLLAHKLQEELQHVKAQHAAALERASILDAELQQSRHQMALWEEKNLSDIIARREQELQIRQLHEEVVTLRSQLEHKLKLLDRVKVLLKKAANKEKALNEKVNALQCLVNHQQN